MFLCRRCIFVVFVSSLYTARQFVDRQGEVYMSDARTCAFIILYAMLTVLHLIARVECSGSLFDADVSEANAVAEFFVATKFSNTTPVTQGNLCLNWSWWISGDSFSRVTALRFNNTSLRGTLPPALATLTSLTEFDLGDNQVSGSIPSELSACRNMSRFDARNNSLSGSLPPSIANWIRLHMFNVSYNNFTGSIPPEYNAWTSMKTFDIGHNNLTGILPPELSTWVSVSSFSVDRNKIAGSLTAEYSNMTSKLPHWDTTHCASITHKPWCLLLPSGLPTHRQFPFRHIAVTVLVMENPRDI